MRILVIVVALIAFVAGCSAEPPAAAFEEFYAATAARDFPAVRRLLCPQERRLLEHVKDDEMMQHFSVRVVLRDVTVTAQNGAAAWVTATDALGVPQVFMLRSDLNQKRGWCVAGAVEQAP